MMNGNGHGPSQEEEGRQQEEDFLDYCEGMVEAADDRILPSAILWANTYAQIMGSSGLPPDLQDVSDWTFERLHGVGMGLLQQLAISMYEPGAPPHGTEEERALQALGEAILRGYRAEITTERGPHDDR